jgi:UDP-glucose 4-epimerase
MKEAGRTASYPAPLHGPARPGDLRSNLVDASRAGTVLGWRPEMGLEEGISRTAAWFVAQQAAN